jgi:hypothetical protein
MVIITVVTMATGDKMGLIPITISLGMQWLTVSRAIGDLVKKQPDSHGTCPIYTECMHVNGAMLGVIINLVVATLHWPPDGLSIAVSLSRWAAHTTKLWTRQPR